MTPVERWSTCGCSTPSASATKAPTAPGRPHRLAPVAAFAEPLVETIALAQPKPPVGSPEVAARLARDSCTGAAAKAFGVKTAAAEAAVRSRRRGRGPVDPRP